MSLNSSFRITCVLLAIAFAPVSVPRALGNGPKVTKSSHHDVSAPLAQMAAGASSTTSGTSDSQSIPVQSTGDNDKALEPHPGVDAHGDEKHDKDVASAPSKPEKLWREAIAEKHAEPPVPPVGSKDAVPKREPLVGIAAIPRHEKFHRVGVANERTR